MQIDQDNMENVCVLKPIGRLDAVSAQQLRGRIEILVDAGRQLVIDMGQVEFIDSTGLGALISSSRRLKELRGDMKLACVNRKVQRVLEMTRAFLVFDIYYSTAAAVETSRYLN